MEQRQTGAQLVLWEKGGHGAFSPPLAAPYPEALTRESSVALAIHWFGSQLREAGKSEATIRNYVRSVAMFAIYVGRQRQLASVSRADVQGFLDWVATRRGRGNIASKTLELRGTAVRAFFGLLAQQGILVPSPAQDVYPRKGTSPLPEILFDSEADQLYQHAARLAEEGQPRPYLLLTLTLGMGLRLGEVVRLTRSDVDLSNPLRPLVHVRYADERHRHKARVLVAPADFTSVYRAHMKETGDHRLFPVTPNALEKALERLGRQAGLSRTVAAHLLRWTWATRQVRSGVTAEALRKRMGLSPLAWRQAESILLELTRPAV